MLQDGNQRREAEAEAEAARAARAVYFRAYYAAHREEILAKNRRWAREHRALLAQRQRARTARAAAPAGPRACLDCGAPLGPRATRCRRCRARFRYAHDPRYRERRLATNRRWSGRQA